MLYEVITLEMGNGNKLINMFPEDRNQLRIEVFSAILVNIIDGVVNTPGFFVDPFVRQRVKGIRQGDNPSVDMDFIPFQSPRVTAAVPFFTMFIGDSVGHANDFALRNSEEFMRPARMRFHHFKLFGSQAAGLMQNMVGNDDLSDIVHGGGMKKQFGIRFADTRMIV